MSLQWLFQLMTAVLAWTAGVRSHCNLPKARIHSPTSCSFEHVSHAPVRCVWVNLTGIANNGIALFFLNELIQTCLWSSGKPCPVVWL